MRHYLALATVVGGMSLSLIGCAKEASVTTEKEVTGPGGTTTVTEETKVETSGENPPPAN